MCLNQYVVQNKTQVSVSTNSSSDKGIKEALIATAINVVLTLLLLNTVNLDVLVSGIYLGLSKEGTYTKRLFYGLNFAFFLLNEGLIKSGFNSDRGVIRGIFVTTFSALILAAIPLGISFVIKKIKK